MGDDDWESESTFCEPISKVGAGGGGATSDVILNDLWSFYFHDPLNNDWNLSSYIKVKDICSVDDFWVVHNTFKKQIHMGMFFVMREHVFPCWDDPYNKDGGCLSIKVLKQELIPFWEELCMRTLGETLVVPEKRSDIWDNINGISTSPKKHFCIIKIWLKSHAYSDKIFFQLPKGNYGDVLYKPNSDNLNDS